MGEKGYKEQFVFQKHDTDMTWYGPRLLMLDFKRFQMSIK